MFELVTLRPEIAVPLGAFALMGIIAICDAVVKICRAATEVRLKERMIDCGMTPDQIERVLTSRLHRDARDKPPVASYPSSEPKPIKSC